MGSRIMTPAEVEEALPWHESRPCAPTRASLGSRCRSTMRLRLARSLARTVSCCRAAVAGAECPSARNGDEVYRASLTGRHTSSCASVGSKPAMTGDLATGGWASSRRATLEHRAGTKASPASSSPESGAVAAKHSVPRVPRAWDRRRGVLDPVSGPVVPAASVPRVAIADAKVCAAQIRDRSHSRRDRNDADARKTETLGAAGLLLVRYSAKAMPQVDALRAQLLVRETFPPEGGATSGRFPTAPRAGETRSPVHRERSR